MSVLRSRESEKWSVVLYVNKISQKSDESEEAPTFNFGLLPVSYRSDPEVPF